MSGFFQNLLKDAAGTFFGSDYLRDYTHAAKTFGPNSYENAPKLKFLYHVYFDINPQAFDLDQSFTTGNNFGLLVKDVKLPSFNVSKAVLNQYNRKRLVQTKINYEPVTVNFHDDNGNLINKLWAGYYTYYYGDGSTPKVVFAGARGGLADITDLSQPPGPNTFRGLAGAGSAFAFAPSMARYNERNQYNPPSEEYNGWGYNSISNDPNNRKIPFFNNITVFGFWQKNFIAYTLINPIITAFSHDTYSYGEGTGIMQNSMTLEYETVVYNEGAIDGEAPGDLVTGFGDESTYDRRLSPIAKPGSNATVLGQGGLVDAAKGFVGDLSGGKPNLIRAIQTAGTAYNTFKNANLKEIIKAESTTMLRNALSTNSNATRNLQFNFANPSATPGSAGVAGAPTIKALTEEDINSQGSPYQVLEPVIYQSPIIYPEIDGREVDLDVADTGATVTAGSQSNTGFAEDDPYAGQASFGG